jgi:hypothetical protein
MEERLEMSPRARKSTLSNNGYLKTTLKHGQQKSRFWKLIAKKWIFPP